MKLLMVVPKHEWNNEDYDPAKDKVQGIEKAEEKCVEEPVEEAKKDNQLTTTIVKSLKEIVHEAVEKKMDTCCLVPKNCCLMPQNVKKCTLLKKKKKAFRCLPRYLKRKCKKSLRN